MQKLYCYVDETGQDTRGMFFIVSVVVMGNEREELRRKLNEIEKSTGKGKVKWTAAEDKARVAYMREVLKTQIFKGKLVYSFYANTTDYLPRTVLTTARAITTKVIGPYKATILIDGLPRSKVRWFGKELRHLAIRTKKVRGIQKEESEPLIRLADALCGFVRTAISGREEILGLLEKAKDEGIILEL